MIAPATTTLAPTRGQAKARASHIEDAVLIDHQCGGALRAIISRASPLSGRLLERAG
jgi:hypothetical protein